MDKQKLERAKDIEYLLSKLDSIDFWSRNENNDSEILYKFTHSILKDMKSLESNTSQLVDEHFWDLV